MKLCGPASSKPSDDAFDRRMMLRAIELARRGEGRVEPNPMVGCVIARRGLVIGEGYHRRFGAPHAEVEALKACIAAPRGATVYLSLEPCGHHGKTPPCTEALIEAKVSRVVAAVRDPSPRVRGRGFRLLRRAGITVETGLLAKDAEGVLEPYLTRLRLGRPYLIAKWAQSLDGCMVPPPGASPWISCPASRQRVHRLRARVDAILVGSGTVMADDPLLTARGVPLKRKALRVVIDGRLRTRPTARIVQATSEYPTLIVTTTEMAMSRKANALRRRGAEVVGCLSRQRRINLSGVLSVLGQRDATNVLVEAGPTLLTAMLRAGLVDEAWVFVAPTIFARPSSHDEHFRVHWPLRLAGDKAKIVATERSGCDLLYRLRFPARK